MSYLKKIYIDVDERYPDHSWFIVDENSSDREKANSCSVTPETLRRWTRIEMEYDAMQKELADLMKDDN